MFQRMWSMRFRSATLGLVGLGLIGFVLASAKTLESGRGQDASFCTIVFNPFLAWEIRFLLAASQLV